MDFSFFLIPRGNSEQPVFQELVHSRYKIGLIEEKDFVLYCQHVTFAVSNLHSSTYCTFANHFIFSFSFFLLIRDMVCPRKKNNPLRLTFRVNSPWCVSAVRWFPSIVEIPPPPLKSKFYPRILKMSLLPSIKAEEATSKWRNHGLSLEGIWVFFLEKPSWSSSQKRLGFTNQLVPFTN